MAQRVTQDFVGLYELLKSRTGNSPSNVRSALRKDGQLAWSIHELHDIWIRVEKQKQFSKSRFIVQAHAKFGEALRDYERRWVRAVENWQAEDVKDTSSLDLLGDADEVANLPQEAAGGHSQPKWDAPDRWEFDPDQDSAADLFAYLEETVLPSESGLTDDLYASTCSRIAGGLKWLRETVGLNLAEIERRWREFPPIIVPEHVSDRHGIKDPRSLFGYLTQIRLAYMMEADLAAIAMCRAATEILIRIHYSEDESTKLTRLIQKTQEVRKFDWLKKHNLAAMVEKANEVLHFNFAADDIEHRDWSRALVRRWVETLQEMILKAPTIPAAS